MPHLRSLLLASILALAATTAHADKVDDFREAASHAGCDSIPYTDLRSNCRREQSDVHPWCDGVRGPVSCVAGITGNLRANLVTAQRDLAAHQDGRRDLEDRRSRAADDAERSRLSAEIEALEKEIGVAKSRIDTARMELERRKDTVERTIDTINRCIDYRLAVMNYFAYATDKVRSESDPALRAYADKLRSMYAESIDGHEKQISDRKRGVETCKKELP